MCVPFSQYVNNVTSQLALYIWNNGEGIRMKDADFLCTKPEGEECATTFPKLFPSCVSFFVVFLLHLIIQWI